MFVTIRSGFVTLLAFSRGDCSGQTRHAVAEAPAQVWNEPARSSLKCVTSIGPLWSFAVCHRVAVISCGSGLIRRPAMIS